MKDKRLWLFCHYNICEWFLSIWSTPSARVVIYAIRIGCLKYSYSECLCVFNLAHVKFWAGPCILNTFTIVWMNGIFIYLKNYFNHQSLNHCIYQKIIYLCPMITWISLKLMNYFLHCWQSVVFLIQVPYFPSCKQLCRLVGLQIGMNKYFF